MVIVLLVYYEFILEDIDGAMTVCEFDELLVL